MDLRNPWTNFKWLSIAAFCAQPHGRSNSEKKTSRNIEKHVYGFDIN